MKSYSNAGEPMLITLRLFAKPIRLSYILRILLMSGLNRQLNISQVKQNRF